MGRHGNDEWLHDSLQSESKTYTSFIAMATGHSQHMQCAIYAKLNLQPHTGIGWKLGVAICIIPLIYHFVLQISFVYENN